MHVHATTYTSNANKDAKSPCENCSTLHALLGDHPSAANHPWGEAQLEASVALGPLNHDKSKMKSHAVKEKHTKTWLFKESCRCSLMSRLYISKEEQRNGEKAPLPPFLSILAHVAFNNFVSPPQK